MYSIMSRLIIILWRRREPSNGNDNCDELVQCLPTISWPGELIKINVFMNIILYKTNITWSCQIVLCQMTCILSFYRYSMCSSDLNMINLRCGFDKEPEFFFLAVFARLGCILQVNHIEGLRSFKQQVSNVFRSKVNEWVFSWWQSWQQVKWRSGCRWW